MGKVFSATMAGAALEEPSVGAGRVLAASVIGSVIEWYDYALYGYSRSSYLRPSVLSECGPQVAMVGTFGTFAAGFVVRPLGRIGRRLLRRSVGTQGNLGLDAHDHEPGDGPHRRLPTYAQAGVWAPVLLLVLRLLQGFAVGGEWGGAVLMAVESAPPGRRGFWGSFPQIGPSACIVLG